jgi:hypothetical protein
MSLAPRPSSFALRPSPFVLLTSPLALLLLLSCTPAPKQFFKDTFYPADQLYDNRSLGFVLRFSGNWNVVTDPARMDKAGRTVAAALAASGAELLFMGRTVEGINASRGIVENLNRSNEQYLATVRALNAASIEEDLGAVNIAAGETMLIRWDYRFRGLRFAEFLFRVGTYNVRIAFWTKPELFDDFLPEFEDIMSTLELKAGS